MKKKIMGVLLLNLIIILFPSENKEGVQTNRSDFIGTWVNNKDLDNRWVFTEDRLTIKNFETEDDVYTYALSTGSPQCGIEVNIGRGIVYLVITSITDSSDQTCFLINGFAETTPGRKTLSISQVNRGGVTLFIKQ